MKKIKNDPKNANRMVPGDHLRVFLTIPFAKQAASVSIDADIRPSDSHKEDRRPTAKEATDSLKEALKIADQMGEVTSKFPELAFKRITLALARYLMAFGGDNFCNNVLQFVVTKACERIKSGGYQSDAVIDLEILSHGVYGGRAIWIVRDNGTHLYYPSARSLNDAASAIAGFGTRHYADENCEIYALQSVDPSHRCATKVTAASAADLYRRWYKELEK